MTEKDVSFYCNKVINKYITKTLLAGLCSSFLITLVSMIVLFLICVLLSEELGLIDIGTACTVMIYILLIEFAVIFILFTQFDLRVLLDLKTFVNKEKAALKMYNRIDIVVGTLDNLCNNLFRDRYTIETLSREVYRFKKLKLPKEDH